jgi:hypothetical protein
MLVSSVLSAFRSMLQVLHLDIVKLDQVLHLPPHFLMSRLSASSSQRWLASAPLPLSLFLDAGDIRGYAGIMWAHKTAWEMAAGTGVRMPRPSGRLGASKPHQYLIHFVWTKYRWISYIICIYGE